MPDDSVDPRTTLLLLAVVSVVVTAPGGLPFVPAGLLLATALALWEGAWLRSLAVPVLGTVLYALG